MSTEIRFLSEHPLVRYHSYDFKDTGKINWGATIMREGLTLLTVARHHLQSACRKAIDQAIQAARDKPRDQRNQKEELLAAEPNFLPKKMVRATMNLPNNVAWKKL